MDEQGAIPLEDDRDEQDKTALHGWGYDAAGVPVCTARMFEERPGVWHIGRWPPAPAARGKGYAGAMMRDDARLSAAAALPALAPRNAKAFYAAPWFSPVGEAFLDCGQPHIEMQKALWHLGAARRKWMAACPGKWACRIFRCRSALRGSGAAKSLHRYVLMQISCKCETRRAYAEATDRRWLP